MYDDIYFYSAIITKLSENEYSATFVDVKEVVAHGKTFDEACELAEDALKLYLFELYEEQEEISSSRNFNVKYSLEKNQTLVIIKANLEEIIEEYKYKSYK